MNRIVFFGLAMFFAIVGIALMGSDSKVIAGHGCHGGHGAGCDGVVVDDCCGPAHCGGRHHRQRRHHRCDGGCRGGLFGHHRRNRCHGEVNACCGEVAPVCCEVAAGPMQAPGKGFGEAPMQAPGKGVGQAPMQAPDKGFPGQAPDKGAPEAPDAPPAA